MTTEQMEITPMQMEMICDIERDALTSKKWRTEVDLHIDQIDDIDVRVTLGLGLHESKTKFEFAHIKIESSEIILGEDCEYLVLYCESFSIKSSLDLKQQIAHLLEECLKVIVTVKFSKRYGKFTLRPPPTYSFCEAYAIKEEHNVVSAYKDCVVCYDKTKTLTNCQHSLCIPCWVKIEEKPIEHEHDDCTARKCPICRKPLF